MQTEKNCWSFFVPQELLNESVACTNMYLKSKKKKNIKISQKKNIMMKEVECCNRTDLSVIRF